MKTPTDDPVMGLAFHCYHNLLINWVYDYQKRVDYIRTSKPRKEQELRLRLFKMIPEDDLPKTEEYDTYIATGTVYNEAYNTCNEAYNTCNEAHTCNEVHNACNEACDVYYEAYDVYYEAYDAYDEACASYIRSFDLDDLHQRLCPNCPWDGETIFSEDLADPSV